MAEKRMFSPRITNSDAFLEMPATARLLYYDLSMSADDDGFVSNPKSVMRMTGARDDDLRVLISKYFILVPDESKGIIVIKHWKINNWIRKDRYHPTVYQNLLDMLDIKDNGSYTMRNKELTTTCQPDVNQPTPECSVEKSSVEKCSVEKCSSGENVGKTNDDIPDKTKRKVFKKPTVDEIKSYCYERNNKVDPNRFFDFYESKDWMVGKNKMKDWKAAIRNWENSDNRKSSIANVPTYERSDF